jgi:hypothetical protein
LASHDVGHEVAARDEHDTLALAGELGRLVDRVARVPEPAAKLLDVPVVLGWLVCDGTEYRRIDYADLYDLIGDDYGAGDGETTFNVPTEVGTFTYIIKY